MGTDDGGERERLAPVIPLFGGPAPVRPAEGDDPTERADVDAAPGGPATAPAGVATNEAGTTADVTEAWHPTWATDRPMVRNDDTEGVDIDAAEKVLLKKLRTRSLSVSEARAVLREQDLDPATADVLLASMEEYGYLDDAVLAEQLVHAGVDRKGQGRQAIAQTMAKRGIPRDVADAALAAMPDDDLERALDFARTKARSLRSLDRDTALRRLTGQLARRGYGGSLAMTAARTALDESGGSTSGVRFR